MSTWEVFQRLKYNIQVFLKQKICWGGLSQVLQGNIDIMPLLHIIFFFMTRNALRGVGVSEGFREFWTLHLSKVVHLWTLRHSTQHWHPVRNLYLSVSSMWKYLKSNLGNNSSSLLSYAKAVSVWAAIPEIQDVVHNCRANVLLRTNSRGSMVVDFLEFSSKFTPEVVQVREI